LRIALMSNQQMPVLRFIDERGDRDRPPEVIEFVGGPLDRQSEQTPEAPERIASEGGEYRRSVRCADDRALRYVFEQDPNEIAHERMIRPC
jgi:hypothetical protein